MKIWSKANTLDQGLWRGLAGLVGPDEQHDSPGKNYLTKFTYFLGIPLFEDVIDYDQIPELIPPRSFSEEELVDLPSFFKHITSEARRRYEQLMDGEPEPEHMPPDTVPQGFFFFKKILT